MVKALQEQGILLHRTQIVQHQSILYERMRLCLNPLFSKGVNQSVCVCFQGIDPDCYGFGAQGMFQNAQCCLFAVTFLPELNERLRTGVFDTQIRKRIRFIRKLQAIPIHIMENRIDEAGGICR